MLYHLGGLAEERDVPPPECWPGLLPFLDAESEEHYWVEDCPRAVGEVTEYAISFFVSVRWWVYSQHAKRLVPFEIMLNVHRRLRLYRKTNQTH